MLSMRSPLIPAFLQICSIRSRLFPRCHPYSRNIKARRSGTCKDYNFFLIQCKKMWDEFAQPEPPSVSGLQASQGLAVALVLLACQISTYWGTKWLNKLWPGLRESQGFLPGQSGWNARLRENPLYPGQRARHWRKKIHVENKISYLWLKKRQQFMTQALKSPEHVQEHMHSLHPFRILFSDGVSPSTAFFSVRIKTNYFTSNDPHKDILKQPRWHQKSQQLTTAILIFLPEQHV